MTGGKLISTVIDVFRFVRLIIYLIYYCIEFYILGMRRIYGRHFGPSEIDKVRAAYAQGKLTDLEMEQQIEDMVEQERQEETLD